MQLKHRTELRHSGPRPQRRLWPRNARKTADGEASTASLMVEAMRLQWAIEEA
ncbi:hypothetical protein [Methylocystis bryophila]|uniref:hypothetical protein n=1 Tax=Methylocystis bryophila TaxID=655015 RepID=UPI0024905FAF|nr:hypothetical protein [Methylocystis bryophila]